MIDEIEMLSALGLNKFVDPSSLVEKAIERRDNPEKGIALPVEAIWSGTTKDWHFAHRWL